MTDSAAVGPEAAIGPLAAVRARLADGDQPAAEALLADLIGSTFRLDVAGVDIRRDGYSLNSVNGFVSMKDGSRMFFKFHQEEGEEDTVGEYYRAELLAEAGYPVDTARYVSKEVGRQILLYDVREAPRFADVCKAHDDVFDLDKLRPLITAQADLDDIVLKRALETLHWADKADYAAEPLLQLFTWRLTDDRGRDRVGGRVRRFYGDDRIMELPGVTLPAAELRQLKWRINGRDYPMTLDDLFADSLKRLHPDAIDRYPAVVAHGDAHNANVWYQTDADGKTSLSWFDPAFAGRHVPALLAEVKATFHNIFAHPLWLYQPGETVGQLRASVQRVGDTLEVGHDWKLSPLRAAFLADKIARYWRPMIAALKRENMLPQDWQTTVRRALFCCPTLVMNLSAGHGMGSAIHTPVTSTVGLAIAVMCGCPPTEGRNVITDFFDRIGA